MEDTPRVTYYQNTGQIENVTCYCSNEYGTYHQNPNIPRKINNITVQCNYLKKKKYMALFFSIFLPFGIDHYYLGNYFIAVPLTILSILALCGNCYRFVINQNDSDLNEKLNIFFVVLGFSLIIFWVLNAILLSIGIIKDSNNMDLADDLGMLIFNQ